MAGFNRFTKENPHLHPTQKTTYRIPMHWVEEFQMKTLGHDTYMYGDIVNRLGKYEDLGSPEEIAKKLGR